MCLRGSRGNLISFVSGVNISRDGLIVTCKHVIEDVQTDVWLDVERLKPGDRWMEELERALAESYSRPVRQPPAERETARSHNESTPFFRFSLGELGADIRVGQRGAGSSQASGVKVQL